MPGYRKNCEPYFVKSDVDRISGFASYCLAMSKIFNGAVSEAALEAQKAADGLCTEICDIHAAEAVEKERRKEAKAKS